MELGGFEIKSPTCFKPMITDRSAYLLELFAHYQKNALWLSGGVADQPAAYMEAMRCIDGLCNEKIE